MEEVERKTCTNCGRLQPLSNYGKQKSSPTGLRYECKDCQKAYMAQWRAEHPGYMRAAEARRRERMSDEEKARKRDLDRRRYHAAPHVAREKILNRKYGIGQTDYDAMLAAQNNGCAICGKENSDRGLAVDHHHGNGNVRGLLCGNCNLGIGNFQDNPTLLAKAIVYLINN